VSSVVGFLPDLKGRGIRLVPPVNFEADYRERVSSTVHVPVDERAGLLHALRSATGGRAETATA